MGEAVRLTLIHLENITVSDSPSLEQLLMVISDSISTPRSRKAWADHSHGGFRFTVALETGRGGRGAGQILAVKLFILVPEDWIDITDLQGSYCELKINIDLCITLC